MKRFECMISERFRQKECKPSRRCLTCGFNPTEAERRRMLPLIEGEDGLQRKYTGTAASREAKEAGKEEARDEE